MRETKKHKHTEIPIMRFLISILFIALLSFAAEIFLPWWSVAVVCFCTVLLFRFKSGKAFASGFLGVFLFWVTVSLFKDFSNEHILSSRMAQLFHVPHSVLFILVSALIGGFVGGLAGWSGAMVRGVVGNEGKK